MASRLSSIIIQTSWVSLGTVPMIINLTIMFPSMSGEHIAIVNNMVCKCSKTYLYVNGVLLADSSTRPIGYYLTQQRLETSGNTTYYGTVDEIRLWNDARTATEIADNMELGSSMSDEDDLIAYYKMSNGSGKG